MDAEEWALPVGVVALLGVLFFLQVPLWGFGPLWLKKVWTRIIRFFKGGDVRRWNWTQIEPGLYVGSLPRTLDDLTELQQAPHNLGGVVSLVEPWEVKVDADALRQLDIQWLLLPTPDYSAPKMQDVENSVAFIDRQLARGKGVLVHCNAGRGRSVTVAMAYLLMKHKADGWDRYRALETVQAVRQTAPMLSCCETRPQWRTLCSFERRLHTGSLVTPYQYSGPPVPYVRTHPEMTSNSSVAGADLGPEQAEAAHALAPALTCITPKHTHDVSSRRSPSGMVDSPATPIQTQGAAEEDGGMGWGQLPPAGARERRAREIVTTSNGHASSPQALTLESATRGRLPLSNLRPLPLFAAAQTDTSYYAAPQDMHDVPMPALSQDPILPAPRGARAQAGGVAAAARLEELVVDESSCGVDVSASRASLSHVDLAKVHHTPARHPTEPSSTLLLPGTPMTG